MALAMKTYKIVRFFRDGRDTEVIVTGLSLPAAREYCQSEFTRGEDWFDGYTEDDEDDEDDA
jgi:hypothetical protein